MADAAGHFKFLMDVGTHSAGSPRPRGWPIQPAWKTQSRGWSQYGTVLIFPHEDHRAGCLVRAFSAPTSGHAAAREPVMAWYRQVKAADWASPAEVKRDIRSASILKDGRVVF